MPTEKKDGTTFSKEELLDADKQRNEAMARLKRLSRGIDLAEDPEARKEYEELEGLIKTTPSPAWRNKGFLRRILSSAKNLVVWALATCSGALGWVVNVAKSFLRFVTRILTDLGECFEF